MKFWTRCVDGVFASRLQQALQRVGIASEVVTEAGNAYTGRMEFSVWVDESAPDGVLLDTYEAVNQPRPTVIDEPRKDIPVYQEGTICRHCGYDLRDQEEDGECPKCGTPYQLVVDRVCPSCKSEVPSNFEICWKCGAEMSQAST